MLELIVASAMVQGALFTPPLDRRMRIVTEQVQRDAGGERRFLAERVVIFGRDGEGLFADVTLVRAEGDAAGGFDRGMAGLRSRTLRHRLDTTGRVTAIVGIDSHWNAFIAGLSESHAGHAEGNAMAARLTAPLAAAAPPQRLAMLSGSLSPLIAVDIAATGPRPLRSISQPGRPPFGIGAMLTGTEQISRDADGRLKLRRRVSGTYRPAHDAIDGADHQSVTRTRETDAVIDPATGLIVETVEQTSTRIGAHETIATTRTSLSYDSGKFQR